MKLLLAGGNSTLARALRPVLAPFAEVITAGRSGCDVALDLAWPAERFELPSGLDAVIHLGASFGGQDFEAMPVSVNWCRSPASLQAWLKTRPSSMSTRCPSVTPNR
jgi:hypothetical protein